MDLSRDKRTAKARALLMPQLEADWKRLLLELPPPLYEDIVQSEEWIDMADGVRLRATVAKPRAEGKWPTVLIRTPYVAAAMMDYMRVVPALPRYGYAVVYNGVRGTMGSGGEWLPFEMEVKDGRDVIDWVARQSFCDGNIGTYGPSYMGHAQWCAAMAGHPALKAMYVTFYGARPYQLFYRRGMFRQQVWTNWAAFMMGENRHDFFLPEEREALLKKAHAVKPHNLLGEALLGVACDWYVDWLKNVKEGDAYWAEGFWQALEQSVQDIDIPILLHGGWFDIFLRAQLDTYRRLPRSVREKSRFIIGPWCHSGGPGGALHYPDADLMGIGYVKPALEWFDAHLKGKPYPHQIGGVETYTIGEGRWRSWPGDYRASGERVLYLHANGADGALADKRPVHEHSFTYLYDPNDPVRSVDEIARSGRGPAEGAEISKIQPPIGARADVISFQTEPLAAGLTIAGSIRVALYVRSTAPATAFSVKVIESFPNGPEVCVRDDITDIRFVDETRILPYEPGTVRELSIAMADVSWQLQKGSRLRVDISSSNYPDYHAHPNVEALFGETIETAVAEQTLLMGGEHASNIVLPIL